MESFLKINNSSFTYFSGIAVSEQIKKCIEIKLSPGTRRRDKEKVYFVLDKQTRRQINRLGSSKYEELKRGENEAEIK